MLGLVDDCVWRVTARSKGFWCVLVSFESLGAQKNSLKSLGENLE